MVIAMVMRLGRAIVSGAMVNGKAVLREAGG